MKTNILKKIVIVLFVFSASFFLFANLLNTTSIYGYNFDESSAWQGDDLGFNQLDNINYNSPYVPFSEIIDPIDPIDETKIYVIENAVDLYFFSERSKGPDRLIYLRLDYVLGNNINYYDAVTQNANYRFIPVGFNDPFIGTFDGQGYEISNLYFRPINTSTEYELEFAGLRYYAMFSRIGSAGVVKNFGVINPIILQPIEWGVMQHVAVIAGENSGLVSHVYYRDTRNSNAGLSAEGFFHISGLVSVNQGTFTDSFVATPLVKSLAVTTNLSVNPVTYFNPGTIERVYYDQELYFDPINGSTLGIGLDTADFQDSSYFSSEWYFNDSYIDLMTQPSEEIQILLKNTYPILLGLDVVDQKLMMRSAVDFVYMNWLLKYSGFYRTQHYVVAHDIDMRQVSTNAYSAANIGFRGTLSGSIVDINTTLYPRNQNQGGDIERHTLLNLTISKATQVGNFASYGLFSALFGRVENLNIAHVAIQPEDLSTVLGRTKILAGVIAGQANTVTIDNVHVLGDIIFDDNAGIPGQILVGGLLGEGSAVVTHSSTNGSITMGTYTYDSRNNQSALGGIIGKSISFEASHVLNYMTLRGLSYNQHNTSTYYLGGILGYGNVVSFEKLVNRGDILSHDSNGFINESNIGGIVGTQIGLKEDVRFVYNRGHITLNLTQKTDAVIAGYGLIDGALTFDNNFEFYSITNNGILNIDNPNLITLSNADLEAQSIRMAGVVVSQNNAAEFYGLFNLRSMTVDLSLIDSFAGIASFENTTLSKVLQSYNLGHLSLITTHNLTQTNLKVSGNILGTNLELEHLRNEGNLTVHLSHPNLYAGSLYILGLFEEVSQNRTAKNGFNGGDIAITKASAIQMSYDIYASGIAYKNANTNYYQLAQIQPQSIIINNVEGPMDHFINDGDISANGEFHGSTRLSGIVLFNQSMITTALNLGQIENRNNVQVANKEVESAGIAYLMIGQYAQIRDSANYGDIISVSTTTLGFTHASGIAVRNDRLENNQTAPIGSNHHIAKILFSINYGNIYAWNELSETGFTIADETRTKAAGILSMGLLSTINNFNYGNVYSRYLGGGVIAFVDLPKFGNIGFNAVYIGNDINYGKIRAITAYDMNTHTFTTQESSMPMRTAFNGFGAIFGKFHTGTAMWDFLSPSPSSQYPLDHIAFGYAFNFDTLSNMFDNAPDLTIDPALPDNDGQGNEILMAIINRMSTVNPNDLSKAPFASIILGEFPKTALYGRKIQSYTLDDGDNGIFNSEFVLRNAPRSTSGTDRYLLEYIDFIPREQANLFLIDKLEANSSNYFDGIYALSSSKGIGNGIFIPDHFEIERLHPHTLAAGQSIDWLGDDSDPHSVIFKLTKGMRQIEAAFASSIYSLDIIQVDANGDPIVGGLILSSPEINRERKMITYYLPSNATIVSQTPWTLRDVYSFTEVSEGLGRKVPDKIVEGVWTYKWVGDYKKSGTDYIPIGPYHTTGIYNVNFRTTTIEDKAGINSNTVSNPVYNRMSVDNDSTMQNFIHMHKPHVQVSVGNNFRWEQIGYDVISASIDSRGPGFAPYATFSYTAPPNYSTLYEYVGASRESVTYIETDVTFNQRIYDDAGLYFKANLDPETYLISDTASLTYNGQSDLELATIPLSYGIYDVMYDAATDTFIDSVDVHYGKVRVYSESYVPGDPGTFQDYNIRIIRTQEETLTALEALIIDGMDAKPLVISNLNSVSATQMIHYAKDNDLGTMFVTYVTENMARGYNVLPQISLYDHHTDVKIHSSFYRINEGTALTNQGFDNLNGTWGIGEVTIGFEVTNKLPSSTYRLQLELLSGETFDIIFEKIESADKEVLSMVWDDQVIVPTGNSHTSMIPFGIYYNALDEKTSIVNFSNLSTLINVYEPDLIGQNIPSYLTDIVISPFATLVSIDLNVTQLEGYRYQYDIIYTIEAEDLSTAVFTHTLIEYPVIPEFEAVYVDGGTVDLPLDLIIITFDASPTFRVEFKTELIYFPNASVLDVTSTFDQTGSGATSIEGIDYFISSLPGDGYEVNFNQLIGIGIYTFYAAYQSEVTLWGQTFTWSLTFGNVVAEKVKNDDSHLKEVIFISETVFAGFDTIVDYQFITPEGYLNYLLHPATRPIVTLPGIGISYNLYVGLPQYYVIGQVQRTNLSLYQPEFVLPFGASIYRVIDQENIGYQFQSPSLAFDFSPTGADDAFNYVQYRVYAQDFDEYPENFTDYFIAVQDVTNNVRFDIVIENQSLTTFEKIYVTLLGCKVEIDYIGECDYSEYLQMMSSFSYYNMMTEEYENNPFGATTYGTYKVLVDLPKGFEYHILLQNQPITGNIFYVEDSIIPKRYRVTIQIVETFYEKPWGKDEQVSLDPNRVFYNFGYLSEQDFIRSGTWLSSTGGFSTTFGSLFVLNPGRDYNVTLNAQMTQTSSMGSYYILFDSILTGSLDTGFALEFNREHNLIRIVERVDGTNGTTLSSVNTLDFGFIPSSSNDPWWMLEHTFKLIVRAVDETTNSLDVYIGDQLIFTNIIYTHEQGTHLGIRGQGTAILFKDLLIEIYE